MSDAKESDPSRCVLCGGPNGCGMVASTAGASEAGDGSCWCMDETFPKPLLLQATALDQGKSCVCRSCLIQGSQAIPVSASASTLASALTAPPAESED